MRRLVELERAAGAPAPDGCAWLDDTTIDDLELGDVARGLDRTVTPVGAQVLWRMIAAPAIRRDVLTQREAALGALGDRKKLRAVLDAASEADAEYIPLLLWAETPRPIIPGWASRAMAAGLVLCIAGGFAVHILWLLGGLLAIAGTVLDDRGNTTLAKHTRALQVFGGVIAIGERVVKQGLGPPEIRAAIAAELPALRPLARRLSMFAFKDPFDISGVVIAALQLRLIAMAACFDVLERERPRMRRLHALVGELDALQSIAAWRDERILDVRVPELVDGPATLAVTELRHPNIKRAIGNSLDLGARSLIVTGSNASGKSTWLRTLGLNAILAQSVHTICGDGYRASLLRVHAAMRAVDTTTDGLSTYAAEVAAIGRLLADTKTPGALFVLDEPFRGTNPAVRVPIVVAVLDYLARGHICLAATHDLDVAHRVSDVFERAYFREADDNSFDFTLRRGTAVTTNAVALLERAGYPAAILDAVKSAITSS